MIVKDAVEVFVDVIEHVHYFHGCAEVAQCGETHNVTEVNGNLVKELRFHFPVSFRERTTGLQQIQNIER